MHIWYTHNCVLLVTFCAYIWIIHILEPILSIYACNSLLSQCSTLMIVRALRYIYSCRFVLVPSTAFYYLPVKSLTAVSTNNNIYTTICVCRNTCMCILFHVFIYRLQTLRHAVSVCMVKLLEFLTIIIYNVMLIHIYKVQNFGYSPKWPLSFQIQLVHLGNVNGRMTQYFPVLVSTYVVMSCKAYTLTCTGE